MKSRPDNFEPIRAEIIAIGDELTSGQRLDTNSQWLSRQLNDLGIRIAFHSTVGDQLQDNLEVFERATRRADLVVCTGGLGPTADDLTRQVIADVAGCPLVLHEPSLQHIRSLFNKKGHSMPESNAIQAHIPEGPMVIPNAYGTAPGIQLEFPHGCVLVALPGVPAELKEMWLESVEPAVKSRFGLREKIYHHTIHMFGKGESHVETMLGDVIQRGRDPLVGITASQATISLRIQTVAEDEDTFQQKIEPTLLAVRDKVGNLIFGENGQTLQQVVLQKLAELKKSVAVVDVGHFGLVGHWLSREAAGAEQFKGSVSLKHGEATERNNPREFFEADFGLCYSVILPSEATGPGEFQIDLEILSESGGSRSSFVGASHPSIRESRIGKWVLNEFRQYLDAK